MKTDSTMKLIRYLSFVFMMSVCFTFISCGDDDDLIDDTNEEYTEGGDWDDDDEDSEYGIDGRTDDGDAVTAGDAIDLGLSVKWSSRNLDAPSIELTGGLYGWADPTGKKVSTDLDLYPTPIPPENICGTKYDLAHVRWGGVWRLPSVEEARELVRECDWKWATYKDRDGMLVTGPNGNTIFLPAVGFTNERSSWMVVDDDVDPTIQVDGYYWTGTLYGTEGTDAARACFLYFDKWGEVKWGKRTNYNFRSTGHSIRPVRD